MQRTHSMAGSLLFPDFDDDYSESHFVIID